MNRRHFIQTAVAALPTGSFALGTAAPLRRFLESAPLPLDYLAGLFRQRDLVLLAEDHAVLQVLRFVGSLVPTLYAAGVRVLGMEFGAAEQQQRLDALVTAEQYDEAAARDMMFFYNVGWAYREYTDIYRQVWNFNRGLPRGAKPFRILNLSYRFDWSAFSGPRTPESMARVFHRGPPSRFRAERVEREVIGRGEKALLLIGLPHAYTRFSAPAYAYNADDFCARDDQALGNRLHRLAPGRVGNVLVHLPLPALPGRKPWLVLPAQGAIERTMQSIERKQAGFDLADSPAGQVLDESAHALCRPDLGIGEVFDGCIYLGPVRELQGCTVDERFFDGRRWEDVRTQVPDPDWRGALPDMSAFMAQVRAYVDLGRRYDGVR